VGGKTYRGWYYAGTFHESGKTFEILYDPLHPEKNTGSEDQGRLWPRIVAWILCTAVIVLVAWLSRKGYLGPLGE
jgi:hypothetical protein